MSPEPSTLKQAGHTVGDGALLVHLEGAFERAFNTFKTGVKHKQLLRERGGLCSVWQRGGERDAPSAHAPSPGWGGGTLSVSSVAEEATLMHAASIFACFEESCD